MILGDLIKEYRREHGYSMDQFAKMSGLSKAYISILERNVNPVNNKPVIPSLETIKAVAQAINMDFNDVIAVLDGNQPVSLKDEPEIPPGFQPMPELVQVPLVGRIEGDATLKRVYLHESFIELRAENPAFESIILAKEDMNTVTIEGKAVGLCRDI